MAVLIRHGHPALLEERLSIEQLFLKYNRYTSSPTKFIGIKQLSHVYN